MLVILFGAISVVASDFFCKYTKSGIEVAKTYAVVRSESAGAVREAQPVRESGKK